MWFSESATNQRRPFQYVMQYSEVFENNDDDVDGNVGSKREGIFNKYDLDLACDVSVYCYH